MEKTNDIDRYILKMYFARVHLRNDIHQDLLNVLEREFLMCDIARGQFGKPSIFIKGNPPLWRGNCTMKMNEYL